MTGEPENLILDWLISKAAKQVHWLLEFNVTL